MRTSAPVTAYAKVTRERASPNRRAARTGSSTSFLVSTDNPMVAIRTETLSTVVSAWLVAYGSRMISGQCHR